MTNREKIDKALAIAIKYGGFDGDDHKTWVIDQMVRALMSPRDYLALVQKVREGRRRVG